MGLDRPSNSFLWGLDRARSVNVYVANVPGPPILLYFTGARLTAAFPVIPILGNRTLGVGALSYYGQST
jgi:diacylglycerol O-acyltransferase / wax synthase